MAVVVPRRKAGWDSAPEDAALVEEVSAPARGIASLAWLRPFASLQQLDLCHNRLICLNGTPALLSKYRHSRPQSRPPTAPEARPLAPGCPPFDAGAQAIDNPRTAG